jgi:hypothetical protein
LAKSPVSDESWRDSDLRWTTLIAVTAHDVLEHEVSTFEARRPALVSVALGKYALVHGDDVAGIYDTEREAIIDGRGRFGYVPLLVERITAEGTVAPRVKQIGAFCAGQD